MDPDALLLADEAAKLNENPTSVAPYVWRPYLTFEQFVHRHCDRPSETVKFFAQTLGLNVSQPRGGTLYYNGTLVADFANRFRWKRPGTLYPQCWRHLAGSKPVGSYAMLLLMKCCSQLNIFDFTMKWFLCLTMRCMCHKSSGETTL